MLRKLLAWGGGLFGATMAANLKAAREQAEKVKDKALLPPTVRVPKRPKRANPGRRRTDRIVEVFRHHAWRYRNGYRYDRENARRMRQAGAGQLSVRIWARDAQGRMQHRDGKLSLAEAA